MPQELRGPSRAAGRKQTYLGRSLQVSAGQRVGGLSGTGDGQNHLLCTTYYCVHTKG